jgi:hypothetical protein
MDCIEAHAFNGPADLPDEYIEGPNITAGSTMGAEGRLMRLTRPVDVRGVRLRSGGRLLWGGRLLCCLKIRPGLPEPGRTFEGSKACSRLSLGGELRRAMNGTELIPLP